MTDVTDLAVYCTNAMTSLEAVHIFEMITGAQYSIVMPCGLDSMSVSNQIDSAGWL